MVSQYLHSFRTAPLDELVPVRNALDKCEGELVALSKAEDRFDIKKDRRVLTNSGSLQNFLSASAFLMEDIFLQLSLLLSNAGQALSCALCC